MRRGLLALTVLASGVLGCRAEPKVEAVVDISRCWKLYGFASDGSKITFPSTERSNLMAKYGVREATDAELAASNSRRIESSEPVLVSLQNDSSRALKKATVAIHLYEKGDSTDLAGESLEWSTVVRPGTKETRCFVVGTSHVVRSSELRVEAKVFGAELFESGDLVP